MERVSEIKLLMVITNRANILKGHQIILLRYCLAQLTLRCKSQMQKIELMTQRANLITSTILTLLKAPEDNR